MSLQDTRLLESRCKLGKLKQALPSEAKLDMSLTFNTNHNDHTAFVIANLGVTAVYPDEPSIVDPPVIIQASYGLRYTFDESMTQQEAEQALEFSALNIVWPYWREFAQSMAVRMGLPGFPVPTIPPGQFTREDHPDRQTGKQKTD